MIERLVLEEGQVELFHHQTCPDVLREFRVTSYRRQPWGAPTFVGDHIFPINAECEDRIVVEEKRGHMVVEDIDQCVGALLLEPGANGLEVLEYGSPGRVVLLVRVVGETDRRGMRYGDSTDDCCHDCVRFP